MTLLLWLTATSAAPSPSPDINLQELLCTPRPTQELLQTFVTEFNLIILIQDELDAEILETLDYDTEDGILTEEDRDFWLDKIIERDFTITSRLPFGNTNPSSFSDADPLGIAVGQDYAVIIDKDATNDNNQTSLDGPVQITGGSNNCTLIDGVTPKIPAALFTGEILNYNFWSGVDAGKCIQNLDETSSGTKRYPSDGSRITIYIRGGEYDIPPRIPASNVGIRINLHSGTQSERIQWRRYPGEKVIWRVGYPASMTNGFFRSSIRRDNLVINGLEIEGRIDAALVGGTAGKYVFADRIFENIIGSTGWEFKHTQLRNIQAIGSSDVRAAANPEYVDEQFDLRASNSCSAIWWRGVNTHPPGLLIKNCYIFPAGLDLPKLTGGGDEPGNTIDIQGSLGNSYVDYGVKIHQTKMVGYAGHALIRLTFNSTRGNQYTIVSYCDLSNGANTCLASAGVDTAPCHHLWLHHNRVHDWCTVVNNNDGNGFQIDAASDCTIEWNVFYHDRNTNATNSRGVAIVHGQNTTESPSSNNQVINNLFYQTGIGIRYDQGYPSSDTFDDVNDNIVENNVIVGFLPSDNASHDAPIAFAIRNPLTNNNHGNLVNLNIILFDTSSSPIDRPGVSRTNANSSNNCVNIEIDGNYTGTSSGLAYPGWTNNSNINPELADPTIFDFTPRESIAFSYVSDAPLISVLPWNYNPLDDICVIIPPTPTPEVEVSYPTVYAAMFGHFNIEI